MIEDIKPTTSNSRNIKIEIPCETCVTQVMCKYKKIIYCEMLLKTLIEIENEETGAFRQYTKPNRVLEKFICDIFDWDYDLTYVYVYKTSSFDCAVVLNNYL